MISTIHAEFLSSAVSEGLRVLSPKYLLRYKTCCKKWVKREAARPDTTLHFLYFDFQCEDQKIPNDNERHFNRKTRKNMQICYLISQKPSRYFKLKVKTNPVLIYKLRHTFTTFFFLLMKYRISIESLLPKHQMTEVLSKNYILCVNILFHFGHITSFYKTSQILDSLKQLLFRFIKVKSKTPLFPEVFSTSLFWESWSGEVSLWTGCADAVLAVVVELLGEWKALIRWLRGTVAWKKKKNQRTI